MEAIIRFKIKDEEEFDNMLEGSILPDETWELYNDKGDMVKFAEYETVTKPEANK